ncbi:MAG: hypothetical protein ACN793_01200 [Buchnera aphidicola (Eriosoma harunire)]
MKYLVFCIMFLFFCVFETPVYGYTDHPLFYVGSKFGTFNSSTLLNHPFFIKQDDSHININSNSVHVPTSLLFGYQKNSYIGFEISYDNTSSVDFNKAILNTQLDDVGIGLGIKLSYPINNKFSVYNKLGGKVASSILLDPFTLDHMIKSQEKLVPIVGIGMEHVIKNNVLYRFEYEWNRNLFNCKYLHNAINLSDGTLSMSLLFQFNHDRDYQQIGRSSFVKKTISNIKEVILFPFGSSKLNSASYVTLKNLNNRINKMNFSHVTYNITGYHDSIDIESGDKKIYYDRVKSVIDYLLSQGIQKKFIQEHELKQDFLMNKLCQNLDNKELLISCLAPNRRVEIEVDGVW